MSPVPIPATQEFVCTVSFQSGECKDFVKRLRVMFENACLKQPNWTSIDFYNQHGTYTWRVQSTQAIEPKLITVLHAIFNKPGQVHSLQIS